MSLVEHLVPDFGGGYVTVPIWLFVAMLVALVAWTLLTIFQKIIDR